MEAIKSYITTLIVVSVTAGIVNIIAPDGNMKKHIKYLIALSVVIILLLPFNDLIYTLPKILNSYEINYESTTVMQTTEEIILGHSIDKIKSDITEMISNRFKITVNDVEIIYNADDYENVTIDKIIVYTNLFAGDIEQYLTDMMYCEIEVINDR